MPVKPWTAENRRLWGVAINVVRDELKSYPNLRWEDYHADVMGEIWRWLQPLAELAQDEHHYVNLIAKRMSWIVRDSIRQQLGRRESSPYKYYGMQRTLPLPNSAMVDQNVVDVRDHYLGPTSWWLDSQMSHFGVEDEYPSVLEYDPRALERLVDQLPEREQVAIRAAGLNLDKDIAKAWGVTVSRVSQIRGQAYAHMRRLAMSLV